MRLIVKESTHSHNTLHINNFFPFCVCSSQNWLKVEARIWIRVLFHPWTSFVRPNFSKNLPFLFFCRFFSKLFYLLMNTGPNTAQIRAIILRNAVILRNAQIWAIILRYQMQCRFLSKNKSKNYCVKFSRSDKLNFTLISYSQFASLIHETPRFS